MTTLGDVLSIVAAILGGFLTLWAAVVAFSLMFPNHVGRAEAALAEPRKTTLRGLFLALSLGTLSIAMSANPLPLMKGLGLILLMWLLGVAVLGAAGVAQVAGRRIQALGDMQPYPALVRGAAFIVGGTMLPFLGWFAFGPLLLAASLGAGWKAVVNFSFRRRATPEAV